MGLLVDAVYYVRPGERNEELRYSLRSIAANLAYDDVWIVGYKPSWLTGVRHVKGNLVAGSPEVKALDNLRRACEADTSEAFIVLNDDMYVMQPVGIVPSAHAGPLSLRIRQAVGTYRRQLEVAQELAQEWTAEPLAWTLHIPLVVTRLKLYGALACIATRHTRIPAEWRTVYGNLWDVPGLKADDVKVRTRRDPIPSGPFLSSSDTTYPLLRHMLAERFPKPSQYEADA